MSPLRETFHFLYANRLKHKDIQPAFGALLVTTILTYLNVLVLTILTDPFTGYFTWLRKHGVPTLLAVVLSMFAIGAAQYFCWIANGKLASARARIESGSPPNSTIVYAYIAVSFFALPAAGMLMAHLGK